MKPLTIEQLKALEVGDWVWVETINAPNSSFRGYYQIRPNAERSKLIFCGIEHDYSILDYGKTWLAYKNKEQAEAKGEIVELPCKVGDKIYVPWIFDDTDGIMNLTVTSITLLNDGTDYFCDDFETDDINFAKQFDLGNFNSTDYNSIWFTDKSEAERRLAELQGEKE